MPYTWSVSKTQLASISSTGWLKANKGGTITVTAMDAIGGTGSSGIISLYDFRLNIPDTIFVPSDSVQMPVYVTPNAEGFLSFRITLNYSTNTYLKLVDVVSTGTLSSDMNIASSYGTGTATIAAAGTSAITSGGVLLFLKFAVPDSTPLSSTTYLNVASIMFDEGIPLALVRNGYLQIANRSIIKVAPLSATLHASVGHKDSTQVTVYNLGNVNLTSTIFTVGSTAFTASLTNLSILPGDSAKLKIYFQPSVTGSDSAKIRFNSNDPFNSTIDVYVTGNTFVNVENAPQVIPKEFQLEQNYPNPFNPSTTVLYNLPVRSQVNLTIYNLVGQVIARLVNQEQGVGYHQQVWNTGNVSSGIYICRLEAVSLSEPFQRIDLIKKMILLK